MAVLRGLKESGPYGTDDKTMKPNSFPVPGQRHEQTHRMFTIGLHRRSTKLQSNPATGLIQAE